MTKAERWQAFQESQGELKLRPKVHSFAQAMEAKLQFNDHRGGWDDADINVIIRLLLGEVTELLQAIQQEGPEEVLYEAADVANYALIAADIMRGLTGENGRH